MSEVVYCSKKDYLDKFDPIRYLEMYVFTNGRIQHMLRCFHEAFCGLPDNLKVLDYGTGPSLLPAMAAVTKASEIILSDYSEENHKFLSRWLSGDCSSFDWSPHFEFLVRNLEGNKEASAIKERQEMVRKTVKAVVHCDLTEDPLIQKGYDNLYDVVISSLVIDTVPTSDEEFVDLLCRLGGLVKKGGSMFLYFSENATFYAVGDFNFKVFPVTVDIAKTALARAGFSKIEVSERHFSNAPEEQYEFTFFFMQGIRT